MFVINPRNSSPTRSIMNFAFFHSTNSRSASAARRSVSEQESAIFASSIVAQRGGNSSKTRAKIRWTIKSGYLRIGDVKCV